MAHPAKLVLIDGHALIYRAYFALPREMATARGEPTNAVFGFASMLLTVLREEQPDYLAVTFDRGRTFRHDDYAEYKANRAAMPDGLRLQFARIDELLAAFHIPAYSAEYFEADDVLAALAEQATAQATDVLIVTGDTDTFQLIDPHVRVLTSRRVFGDTITYDEAGIRERYDGLEPKQLIDLKALLGDKSDNVPGVSGIGEKTAIGLLKQYGSLEAVYDHLAEITPARFRKALEEGRTLAFLSKHLVTIRRDVPVQLDLPAARVREPDHDRVTALFRALEFKTLLARLPWMQEPGRPAQLGLFDAPPAPEPLKEAPPGYAAVSTLEELDALAARLAAQGRGGGIAVDVETTGLDPMSAELVGISLSAREGEGYYIPVGHRPGGAPEGELALEAPGPDPNLDLAAVVARLRPVLGDPAVQKLAHNANYDLTVLAERGLDVAPLAFDTMIAEWLANPAGRNLGLKDLAAVRLGIEMTHIEELIGTGKKQITMDRVPVDRATPYACADVDMTLRLARVLEAELRDKAQWRLFSEVEMPLVPVIVDMQRAGVKLDLAVLAQMSKDLAARLGELQTQIEQHCGHPLNINSTQQLSVTLFEEMKLTLPWMRKGKSGHYSTAADVLEKLKGRHPIVDLILEHRQLTKLKGTYVDALPLLVNKRTGRVHTSFNQTGSVTGRLSSSNPNLQNIPIRTDIGREIRRAFVTEDGCRLLAVDYSQVELRVLAHVAQDPAMLAAFARGEDIHASTAAAIYKVPLAEVTSAQRRVAKMTNFAISYGVTGYGLSERTGLPQDEAEKFIQTYFDTYPAIRAYLERTRHKAQTDGYVETLLGRRRYFPELMPGARVDGNTYQAAYRMAINAPIQGCLPAHTRVLTSEGYQKIGDLCNSDWTALRVWTGTSFVPFQILDRGQWESAEIELENGVILPCDTRHEVLTVNEEGYAWKKYGDLMPGDQVCLSMPAEIGFGSPLPIHYQHVPGVYNGKQWVVDHLDEQFYYWLGFYLGDGSIAHNPEAYRWNIAFCIGPKVDCFSMRAKVAECVAYFRKLGLDPKVREASPKKTEVVVYSRGLIEFLASIDVETRADAHTKRVPDFVLRSPIEERKAYLRGVLDSDGTAGSRGASNPSIHLCQRNLLQDLWLLFRSVGVEGKIRGPYIYRERTSYRLDLVGGMLQQSLGFSGRSMVSIPGMSAPRFLVDLLIRDVSAKDLQSRSFKVLLSRLRHGGVTSIYTLAAMWQASGTESPAPLYTWSRLREKRALGKMEETYTLSVADPLHRFDSEGIISKNTAADIIKVAMHRLWNELRARGFKSKLLLQVHDELVLEVPEGEMDAVAPLVIDTMEGAHELDAPLRVDARVGRNWLEMQEYRRG